MRERPFIHANADVSEEELAREYEKTRTFTAESFSFLRDKSLEMTEEERWVVDFTMEAAFEMVSRYKKNPKNPEFQVYVLPPGTFDGSKEILTYKFAFCEQITGQIFIERLGSLRFFSRILFHEMTHLFSFNSFQLYSSSDLPIRALPYRGGLQITRWDPIRNILLDINEAVTVDLEREYVERMTREMPNFLPESEADIPLVQMLDAKRYWYRVWLVCIRKIQKQDPSLEEQEIKDWFRRAYYTGNLLPLARRIEHLFGRGTFADFMTMGRKEKE